MRFPVPLPFRWVHYLREKLGFWLCKALITSAKTLPDLSLYQLYCFMQTLQFWTRLQKFLLLFVFTGRHQRALLRKKITFFWTQPHISWLFGMGNNWMRVHIKGEIWRKSRRKKDDGDIQFPLNIFDLGPTSLPTPPATSKQARSPQQTLEQIYEKKNINEFVLIGWKNVQRISFQ